MPKSQQLNTSLFITHAKSAVILGDSKKVYLRAVVTLILFFISQQEVSFVFSVFRVRVLEQKVPQGCSAQNLLVLPGSTGLRSTCLCVPRRGNELGIGNVYHNIPPEIVQNKVIVFGFICHWFYIITCFVQFALYIFLNQ